MKKYYIGRTMQDVPDIDGLVYIKNENIFIIHPVNPLLYPNKIHKAKIAITIKSTIKNIFLFI